MPSPSRHSLLATTAATGAIGLVPAALLAASQAAVISRRHERRGQSDHHRGPVDAVDTYVAADVHPPVILTTLDVMIQPKSELRYAKAF
jgi:hypothetical protein